MGILRWAVLVDSIRTECVGCGETFPRWSDSRAICPMCGKTSEPLATVAPQKLQLTTVANDDVVLWVFVFFAVSLPICIWLLYRA